MDSRNCTRCKGSGKVEDSQGTQMMCRRCGGRGNFDAPDKQAILAEICATRGKNKGKLKASLSSYKASRRAYYVWRMARFHGGKDMTMPVMAGVLIGGDPFNDELDTLADEVARQSFGSDLRAAARWGRALGL